MSNDLDTKTLGEISIEDLRTKLIENGVEWAKDASSKTEGTTRIETRRSWEIDGREATDEEVDLFVEMPFILGSSVTPVEPREFTQHEIDQIANEVTSVNKTKDILDGRVAKIRSTIFESFKFLAEQDGLEDPDYVPNALVSEKYGVKLCKEITGGKPYIDIDLAREILGDRFDAIVNRIESIKVTYTPDGNAATEEVTVEYEVNEKALETQVALGNITIDELTKVTLTTKKVQKFITRKL